MNTVKACEVVARNKVECQEYVGGKVGRFPCIMVELIS